MDSDLKGELTCPVCMELFCRPLRLGCGHSYCRGCLLAMAKRSVTMAEPERHPGAISCPECRRVFDIPSTGVDSLQVDFKLSKLVDVFKKMETDEEEFKQTTVESSRVKSVVTETPSPVSTSLHDDIGEAIGPTQNSVESPPCHSLPAAGEERCSERRRSARERDSDSSDSSHTHGHGPPSRRRKNKVLRFFSSLLSLSSSEDDLSDSTSSSSSECNIYRLPERRQLSVREVTLAADRSTTDVNRSIINADRSITDVNRSIIGADRSTTDGNRSLIDPDRSITDVDRSNVDAYRSIIGADMSTTDGNRSVINADRSFITLNRSPMSDDRVRSGGDVIADTAVRTTSGRGLASHVWEETAGGSVVGAFGGTSVATIDKASTGKEGTAGGLIVGACGCTAVCAHRQSAGGEGNVSIIGSGVRTIAHGVGTPTEMDVSFPPSNLVLTSSPSREIEIIPGTATPVGVTDHQQEMTSTSPPETIQRRSRREVRTKKKKKRSLFSFFDSLSSSEEIADSFSSDEDLLNDHTGSRLLKPAHTDDDVLLQ